MKNIYKKKFNKNNYQNLRKNPRVKLMIKIINDFNPVRKKILVIIGTTNGFIPQKSYGGNPYQTHRSGFSVQDFTLKGYRVLGMDGPGYDWLNAHLRGVFIGEKYKLAMNALSELIHLS